MANFTAGTSFSDGVTNDVTAAKLNALVADAVPTSNLSLNSTTGTIGLFSSGTGTAASPAIQPTGDTNTGLFFPAADTIAFSEGGAEAMRIDSSGNVGIKNSTPSSYNAAATDLVIGSGSSNSGITISGSTNGLGSIHFADGTSGDTAYRGIIKYEHTTDNLQLFTAATERLRIDSSGNVLANTTSTALFSETSGSGLCYRKGASLDILVTNDNALILNKIGADGGIAEFRKSATIVGTISVSGSATAYNTSSDYRLKTNLDPISDGIARIKQLPVYRFNWISNPIGNKVDGFVAHEAQAIVPECVTGEKDAVDADGKPIHQGIDQSKIVPLLTAALKEAIAKIETLEAKVTALEAA